MHVTGHATVCFSTHVYFSQAVSSRDADLHIRLVKLYARSGKVVLRVSLGVWSDTENGGVQSPRMEAEPCFIL